MWEDEEPRDSGIGRASAGSEVVIISDQDPPALVPRPPGRLYNISNMNLTDSPGARIGNNFLTVTNISHSDEVVKGRFLCLELTSPANARRLRCSVAVFVCWALVVASGFAAYFFYLTFSIKFRIDIDVPCHKYMWAYVKNSTRAEQLCCSVAVFVLVVCVALAVYFGVFYNRETDSSSNKPWYIEREEWLAEAFNNTEIDPEFEPLRLVVIQHSVSNVCHRFAQCSSELRNIQEYYIVKYGFDIPYNFLVGNDGRVYEGRGWRREGAHTQGFNRCALGIGFIGDYREGGTAFTQVSDLQQNRTLKLLEEGVKLRFLHHDFKVVGAKDVKKTESPGENLYTAIRKWPQYDFTNRFYNKTCEVINAMPFP